jgi:hypothetical protein
MSKVGLEALNLIHDDDIGCDIRGALARGPKTRQPSSPTTLFRVWMNGVPIIVALVCYLQLWMPRRVRPYPAILSNVSGQQNNRQERV